MENVIIIGSGPAGYTAAIYAGRAKLNPLLLTGSLVGGQLTQTSEIENFPGFPEGIQGFDLMANMKAQAERFDTRIENTSVTGVELTSNGTQKVMCGEMVYESKTVIIATGAAPRWLGIPSEQRLMAKGVTACATCDGFFYRNLPVVVIGGGDTAMEEALFLTRFASSVTVIHRRDALRASKIMSERALNHPKISFQWDSVVEEVLGEREVEGVRIKNLKTNEEKTVECKGFFVALGHIPNTTAFKGAIEMNEAGYIQLKNDTSATSIAGVFAAGDCADAHYRQAVTAAGMGCKAAIEVERYLGELI